MLSLESISKSITIMDETYDANFGEWIRNEENAKVVGYSLKKYLTVYDTSIFIIVTKWIVKDWTLRSIICFTKKMLVDDVKKIDKKKMAVMIGIVYTWNGMFIAEFMLAILKVICIESKLEFVENFMIDFEREKIDDIVKHLGNKIENKMRNVINKVRCMKKRVNRKLNVAFNT